MPSAKLTAVVVGCGVGSKHADAYNHSDATDLVGICDLDEARLQSVADEHDVEARYTDFETMLQEQQPDLISIATAQPSHAVLTVLAATRYAPKGILCEKGMANNMGEARAMLATCDRNGIKMIIGHEGRYLTQVQQARDLVAEGAIGDVQISHVWYDQGGMMNQMCHGCDRALFIMGDPRPIWVMGNVQRDSDRWERGWPAEERAMGVVGFADGARLMLEGETPPGGHLEKHRHTLVGTEGMMIARTEGEATSMLKPGEAPDDPVGLRIHRMDGRVESFEFPGDTYQNARRREIDTFARWVAGDVDGHAQDAHVCIRTQEILMAIYESARTHSLVELPMKTQASPLVEMIDSGALPVRNPGFYDTRHRAATAPVQPAPSGVPEGTSP